MTKTIDIALTNDEALILFEWLAKRWETVRHTDKPFDAEEIVLAHLHGALERNLVEIFSPNYADLLADARRRIVDA